MPIRLIAFSTFIVLFQYPNSNMIQINGKERKANNNTVRNLLTLPFSISIVCMLFVSSFFSVSFFALTASIRRHWYSGLNLGIKTNSHAMYYIFWSRTNWWTHSIVSMTFPRYSYVRCVLLNFSIRDYYVFVSSIPMGKWWYFFF